VNRPKTVAFQPLHAVHRWRSKQHYVTQLFSPSYYSY